MELLFHFFVFYLPKYIQAASVCIFIENELVKLNSSCDIMLCACIENILVILKINYINVSCRFFGQMEEQVG